MAKAHFHDEEGRGGYFAPESGTSEAQFLSIKGFLSVYCATKDTKGLDLAEDMMEAALQYLFPSAEVSDKFSKNNLWLPHWLYNASDPFTAERAFYDEEVHFLLGIGHLKTDRPRKIFSIRAAEAKLEWENIFSKVVGEAYEFKYLLAIKGFDIQLEKPFTGTLKVVYTCMGTDTIERNEQYEAWPHWRKLKEGENACAIDSLFWCYDCFDLLSKYSQRNRGKWSKAKEVMRESIAYALQVENLGDYIAKDFHNDNPFTQAGMYEWQNRSQAAVYTRNRKDGALQIQVPAGEGPVQFGNGSLDNAIGKSHTFKVCLKSDLTSDINVILATANEYSPETRYVASVHVNRSETAEEYELSISDFVKGLNWVPSYGVSGYYSPSSTVSSNG